MIRWLCASLFVGLSLASGPALGADHADTPNLVAVGRHDGRITDLHAFRVGNDLVLSLSTNPNIPIGQTSYAFASDLQFTFHIDNRADVDFSDSSEVATFGGRVRRADRIDSRIDIEVTFPEGQPVVNAQGLRHGSGSDIAVFAGLRDDPFIRGPRQGRNVASIVIQIPLTQVIRFCPTLLIWATSNVPNIMGDIEEHAGRALRSQFPENDPMNNLPPAEHQKILGVVPDVIIYDVLRPAAFPNGRALEDDVVDLVGHAGTLASDAPFPSANDVPFSTEFPYLAPPH